MIDCPYHSGGACELVQLITGHRFPVTQAACAACTSQWRNSTPPSVQYPTMVVTNLCRSAIRRQANKSPSGTTKPVISSASLSEGVGTRFRQLSTERMTCQHCPACDTVLARMNQLGPKGCREKLIELVSGMVPRAIKCGLIDATWREKFQAVKDAWTAGGIAAAIESVVLQAIEETEAAERQVPFAPQAASRRNLAMFLLPVAGNGVWQWHVQQIARRWKLFNGQKVLTLAQISTPTSLPRRPEDRVFQTDNLDIVLGEFRRNGMEWDAVVTIENDVETREGAGFLQLLREVQSTDPAEATFFCHGKAACWSRDHIGVEWADAMYTLCLDHLPTIQQALRTHSMTGAFKRYDAFRLPGNHCWHYSGSFYWMRHDQIFSGDWNQIEPHFASVESWPGLMIPSIQGHCLLLDNAHDMYELPWWEQTVRPALAAWRAERGV